MNIRGKLTLRFLSIVFLIFITASFAIYLSSADYRIESFYGRLLSKANSVAKILAEVDEVDATLLKKIEKDNVASLPKERITIYDLNHEIQFSTDEDSTLKVDSKFLDRVRSSGEIRYKQGEFENAGFVYKGGGDTFIVIAGAVDIFGIRRLQNLKTTLIIINGVSFALVFVSGFLFSGQALAPIKKVINQVDEIGVDNLNLRVEEGNGTDEIARLAKTFNRMLERIEDAFKVQKDFIANASHELRTPLTAIIGQLEVNLMKERTVEEYKESSQSALDEMKNLNSIANRLLLLAQASTGIEEMNFSKIRIDEVLWQVKSELQKRNPEYKIHIELSEDLTDDKMLTVSGSEELLKTAFINLADNGCKYSTGHEVWINLYMSMSGNIMVQFKDRGIGILPEDINKIFEPFHRGKNALSYKGHGIGLSLVKRIVTLHDGKIELESSVGTGSNIKVTLPNAI